MAGFEVVPSANRLMDSLRDMGYDFSQAVADIVDNSIEAGASLVSIDAHFDGENSWIRISDNGKGMTPEALREAMRFGAERKYAEDDLGKFGLGMKTASISQCRQLIVASRWNTERADIAAYSWDLDHIKTVNKWEVLPVERSSSNEHIRAPLRESTGTVVLWVKLDRIVGLKHPSGEVAKKRFAQLCADAEKHLGMVFHRFISGQVRGKKLKIKINGNLIQAWDPFCTAEKATKVLQKIDLSVEYEGVRGDVSMIPYVLPHKDEFSSQSAADAASGPANWNQQQGFYIYRAGRMIQSGGWSGVRVADEHTKLARIAVDFSPILDGAFKVNVAKMRVQLPSSIRDEVKGAIVPVIKIANEAYRGAPKLGSGQGEAKSRSGSAMTTKSSASSNNEKSSARANSMGAPSGSFESRDPQFTQKEWARRLLKVSKSYERPIIKAVLERL